MTSRGILTVCLSLCGLLMAPSSAARANVVVAGVQDLGDLGVHNLFTNGIAATGTQATINSFATDTWTVSIRNTSQESWADFEIVIPGAGVIFPGDPLPTVAGGFGGTAENPASFALNPNVVNNHGVQIFASNPSQVVAPGATIDLRIPVVSGSAQNDLPYNLTVQATVPEPATFVLAGALLAAFWRFQRRNS